MTYPTVDVSTTNVDAAGDSPSAARADLLDLITKFNQLRAHLLAFATTGVMADTVTAVTFGASPTFDASLSNVFHLGNLTGNVTSMTITNPAAGRFLTIRFKQDATGGRTVAIPAGAKISGVVGSTVNQVSYLNLAWNATDTRWEGSWTVLPP